MSFLCAAFNCLKLTDAIRMVVVCYVFVCVCCMQRDAGTRLRGAEEVCGSISPTDGVDLSLLLAHRSRTTSAMSSVLGDDELAEEG